MRRSIQVLLVPVILSPASSLIAQDPPSETEVVRVTAPSAGRPTTVGLPWEPVVGYVRQFSADTLVLDANSKDGIPTAVSFPLSSIQKVEVNTYLWRGFARDGDSVRVVRRDGQAVDGHYASSTDTLRLTVVSAGNAVSLTAPQVDHVLVRQSGLGHGARVGFETGLAVGLIAGLVSWGSCSVGDRAPGDGPCGAPVGKTVGLGVGVGVLLGAAIGSGSSGWRRRERTWVEIPLERLRQRGGT